MLIILMILREDFYHSHFVNSYNKKIRTQINKNDENEIEKQDEADQKWNMSKRKQSMSNDP